MIKITHPGLYSSIQDQGRQNGSHLGIPSSGAMDKSAAKDANILLQNDVSCSLIESTIIGPEIIFYHETAIAITGALIQPFINGIPSSINRVLKINQGDTLTFGRIIKGARFYIAVRGGFRTQPYLGSQSACITASISSLLVKEQLIPFAKYDGYYQQPPRFIRVVGNKNLKARRGPEFYKLEKSENHLAQLFDTEIEVGKDSNRMAYRVHHSLDLRHQLGMISSAVIPGTVQLTPDGALLFLMRDAQTTGGYPRILQLTEESICDMAQLKPKEKFTLTLE